MENPGRTLFRRLDDITEGASLGIFNDGQLLIVIGKDGFIDLDTFIAGGAEAGFDSGKIAF